MNNKKFGKLRLFDYKPTIIAEAGVNHNCDIKLAKKYINLASKAGADAIKFQTYKADKLVSKSSLAYWDTKKEKTKSQYKLFKKYEKFNFSDYLNLHKYCKKKNLLFMTTLFDTENIRKYDKIIDVYKISSSDITNVPLLKEISKKNKHTIISTGASTIDEIKMAIKYLNLPKEKICIMHCVLNYPTLNENANLGYIKILKKKFPKYMIGYSDHTNPEKNLDKFNWAFELGAQIIEKHFTHNNKLKGNDHYHAMNFENLRNFTTNMNVKKLVIGNYAKNILKEKKSRKYARRAIFANENIKIGDKFTEKNLITLRPEIEGISSKYWNRVIGKTSKFYIKKNSPIKI